MNTPLASTVCKPCGGSEAPVTATFAPHDTSEDVVVTLINDATPELTETFVVNLDASSVANAAVADYQGTGTITDDDEATITGYVFMDVNGNGFFDESTEWVLEDVTVNIEDSQGGTDTDTTDASGYYSVNVLLGEVRVEVDESTVPDGSALSTDNSPQTADVTATDLTIDPIGYTIETTEGVPASSVGNGGGYNDDTVYGGTGNDLINGGAGDDYLVGGHWLGPGCAACDGDSYDATLTESSGRIIVDSGSLPAPGSIGNRVFLDSNGDGMRNAGEPGIANVQVNLYDAEFTLVASTYTDATGTYTFGSLNACDYYVQFLAPSPYRFTTQDVSGNAFNNSDSDADPLTGLTASITLAAGQTITNVDAGLVNAPAASAGPWSLQFSDVSYSVRETDGQALITILRTP
ncbi:MAG: carboxypeptidase regulatory-like domain-containing protein, partial [Chloroflexi bacterium]|nr:carboxypeptidase regulatory-like domain-containing protein [Chloroflexota bacterium]